jgi:hypothetical protein
MDQGTQSGAQQEGSGWRNNAERAIVANPGYFVWWYTAKSLALVVAVAWGAYLLGKSHGRRLRR